MQKKQEVDGLYSQKHLFFEKFMGKFPVFTGFIFENLLCLTIVQSFVSLCEKIENFSLPTRSGWDATERKIPKPLKIFNEPAESQERNCQLMNVTL